MTVGVVGPQVVERHTFNDTEVLVGPQVVERHTFNDTEVLVGSTFSGVNMLCP